jgi:vancomycin resistance protein VanW
MLSHHHNPENLFRPHLTSLRWVAFRRRLGRRFYILKRHVTWIFTAKKWAKKRDKPFEHCIFSHETPLFRPLKNVETYLQHNKVVNLRLAAASIDGIVIHPGETFSFWKCVGAPTARRGFLSGLVLQNGRVGTGIGGGLCQMGNLLYWMALHSEVSVTERWRHSYDVFPDVNRQLPFGSGATLSWNYIDLQLRNDTQHPIQLRVWVSDEHLHGEIRSPHPSLYLFQVLEKEHVIRHEPWGGYSRHNRLLRQTFDDQHQLLKEEWVAENHALLMYQPFISEGKDLETW